ncbi:MAG: hypothetical protein A2297_01920 [Elusimicrobia bacterium RIFOXYB2_FULL_48_7]|nr:MAG: hypothetical protein A2297_01920 [Elusimicrobia bacterium RIFOXYB2_FULL_48_7]
MKQFKTLLVGLLIGSMLGCATISPFSQHAYSQAVELKVDALRLMDNATDTYSKHTEEVEQLLLRIEKAYEYEKGRPKNEITTQLWEMLIDPDKDMLGTFLKDWKTRDSLEAYLVGEKKKQIRSAFDKIIELESGKRKE